MDPIKITTNLRKILFLSLTGCDGVAAHGFFSCGLLKNTFEESQSGSKKC